MARPNNKYFKKEPKEFDEKVIEIKRLSKKTSGGNKISFSALVVLGDKKGRVGVGLDKAADVMSAIKKAIKAAKKRIVTINLTDEASIPHEINSSQGASRIIMKPAPKGTGIIAGGSVRAVVEAAGIKNIVTKSLGSKNKALNVNHAFRALQSLKPIFKKTPKQIVKEIKETPKPVAPAKKAVAAKKIVAQKAPVKKSAAPKATK